MVSVEVTYQFSYGEIILTICYLKGSKVKVKH